MSYDLKYDIHEIYSWFGPTTYKYTGLGTFSLNVINSPIIQTPTLVQIEEK
jgi:hypothetical protein